MKWVLGAIALLAVGMIFQLGLLVYAMYVLLGVIGVSRFLTRRWIESLVAVRDCNRDSVQIGDTVAVADVVQNAGSLPIPWLLIEDSLPAEALAQRPPRIKVTGPRVCVTTLRPGGEKTLFYQLKFQMRGYYQIGPLLLESGDPFGLHRRFKVVTEPRYILVYPRVVPLKNYDLASRRPIGEIRLTHRLFEDPTRISGVRPYQHGDPLNRVHWRATARTGELHSKTFEASCIAGVSLLLDFHRDSHRALDGTYTSELAVTTAASLANAVYQTGQQTGLYSNGRDAADRVRDEGWGASFHTRETAKQNLGRMGESDRLQPVAVETRRGPEQFMRILETLARLELTDGMAFPDLVNEVRSGLSRDATVVAILREVPIETAVALGGLLRNGFAVTALVVVAANERPPDWASPPEWAGRLLSQGIRFRIIDDEESLADLCAETVSH